MFRALKTIVITAAMVASVVLVPTSSSVAAEPRPIDPGVIGTAPTVAAGSCWEIKQSRPAAADGTYWLLTPAMSEPGEFYCDMTTDGGGWVLIGKGRDQWTYDYPGKNQGQLLDPNPGPGGPKFTAQLNGETIDQLINRRTRGKGEGVADKDNPDPRFDQLPDGVRLRRATNAAGTAWQEVRFKFVKRDRWTWTFGANHRLGSWSFDSATGSGSVSSNFGSNNTLNRVNTIPQSNQGWVKAFAFGSSARGTTADDSYLYSKATNLGYPQPYTQVYIRPRVLSTDPGFTRIPNGGLAKWERRPIANSNATPTPWSVTGLKGSVAREGSVEVQTFTESKDHTTMYVGGNFRYVQQVGSNNQVSNQVEQSFLAAFDSATGEWKSSFRPTFNEQVRALATLPDGRIVAGGDFTEANGQARTIVALDPVTGATDPSFKLNAQNAQSGSAVRVNRMKVFGNKLYVAGQFTHLANIDNPGLGQYTQMLGRADATTGIPDSWNPRINWTIIDFDLTDAGDRVFAAGFFTQVGTVDQESGTGVSTDPDAHLVTGSKNWTPDWSNSRATYQQAVAVGGDRVWFGGSEHALMQFRLSDYVRTMGSIMLAGGDFQTAARSIDNEVMYAGCHCNRYRYHDAYTWPDPGTQFSQADSMDYIGSWDIATGDLRPEWAPTFGSRLDSGAWASLAASDGAMWVGGDFTTVTTKARAAQKAGGFARFEMIDNTAPNAVRDLKIETDDSATNQVTLSWKPNGNGAQIRYQVLRDNRPLAATATGGVTSITVPKGGGDERFFVRAVDAAGNYSATGDPVTASAATFGPSVDFSASVRNNKVSLDASGSRTDANAAITAYNWQFGDGDTGVGRVLDHAYEAAGAYTVTLTVTDTNGKAATATKQVVVDPPPPPAPADLYGKTIYNQDPYLYYRLEETSGDMIDSGQNRNDGRVGGTNLTRGVAGVSLPEQTDGKAIQMKVPGFLQTTTGYVASKTAIPAPNTFSVDVWFKTGTTKGGRLVGFANSNTGNSSTYDRHLLMLNTGQLMFGVYPGAEVRLVSPASYNDNAWHHAVATMGADGMNLYVDGASVAANPNTAGESATGYWKIGTDMVWSGTTNKYFDGTIDEVAVFDRALSATEVELQYGIATGDVTGIDNEAPTAAFDATATGSNAATFDASSSTDPDGTIATYVWEFGDGETGTDQVISHIYGAPGSYSVKLTVTDNDGATDSITRTVVIKEQAGPNQVPKPVIGAEQVAGSLVVDFDAAGSTDDGEIIGYEWLFGDGATSNGPTASHAYPSAGDYTVTLTATDNDGATGTATRTITVADPNEPVTTEVIAKDAEWKWRYEVAAPDPAWNTNGFDDGSWNTGQGVLGWPANAVKTRIDGAFAGNDRPLTAYFRKTFDITDVSKVTKLALNTVADDGVIVYVNGIEVGRQNMTKDGVDRNGHNAYAPSARSTAVAEADPLKIDVPVGLLVNGTNTITADSHVNFRGTANLTFHLEAELTTDPTANVENQAPTAAFTSDMDGLKVTFDGSDSSDADGIVTGYAWTFGDGSPAASDGPTTSHTYAAGGTYPVTLTVTDNRGATASVSHNLTVVPGPSTQVVVADNAQWRWWYKTEAPDPAWTTNGFDASSWNLGGAVLGWGQPAVVTNIDTFANTDDRARAAYFIGTFDVSNRDKVTELVLRTVADDGVIVYVNGVEVGRQNMTKDGVDRNGHNAYAPSARSTAAAEADPLVISVPTALLVNGINTIAAETHLNFRATANVTYHLKATMTTADP